MAIGRECTTSPWADGRMSVLVMGVVPIVAGGSAPSPVVGPLLKPRCQSLSGEVDAVKLISAVQAPASQVYMVRFVGLAARNL